MQEIEYDADGVEGTIERSEDIIREGFQILKDFPINELMKKIYNEEKYVLLELLEMIEDSISNIVFLTEKK